MAKMDSIFEFWRRLFRPASACTIFEQRYKRVTHFRDLKYQDLETLHKEDKWEDSFDKNYQTKKQGQLVETTIASCDKEILALQILIKEHCVKV